MKKQVARFANSKGIDCHYSGKTKTLYFGTVGMGCGSWIEDFDEMVLSEFGYGLPFKIDYN